MLTNIADLRVQEDVIVTIDTVRIVCWLVAQDAIAPLTNR